MKVTVVNFAESLDYIPNGETILFEKKKNEFNPYEIKAFHKNKNIGNIASSETMNCIGCTLDKDVYKKVSNSFQGIVLKKDKICETSIFDILVVEI